MKIPLPPVCALLCAASAALQAQVTVKVASVGPPEAIAGAPITIIVDLRQAETIDHAYLVYRTFGQSQYERVEMDIVGSRASATLPSSVVQPPSIEYYVVLADHDGVLETYPLSENADPFTTPPAQTVHLPVVTQSEEEAEVVFLSPDPLSVVSPEDVVISVSLLRADSNVVKSATQLFLDGADITSGAVFSGDIIVYAPDNLSLKLLPGVHRVAVRLYNRKGNLYRVASLVFTVQGEGAYAYTEPVGAGFKYGLSFQAESRHEDVAGVGTWYNRAGYQFTGSIGEWRFASNVFATSDEKSDRQPQNRYYVGAESPWIKAGLGDSYPTFPNLILSGKRVRGLNSSLRFGFFNVDLALGSISRAVEGSLLSTFSKDSLAAEQQRDPAASYAPVDSSRWGKFTYGTYARKLFIVRPSFGSGRTFQFGFTWLKAKDDVSSIRYGIRPQENLVLGSDFVVHLDDRRIELSGQGAFSAYNTDISSGTFSDSYIDSVYTKDPEAVKHVRDLLKPFITVNDNIRPLSLKRLSTVAYDLGLGLNYLDQAFRFSYIYRGRDYNSFGQTFLRNDIQGYNVQDRTRFVDNQLYLTLGFERLHDNTDSAKAMTTAYTTINAAVSYYPRADLPGVTIGFAHFRNTNGAQVYGPDSLSAVDDRTERFYLQSSYTFEFLARNTASFHLSTSDRVDHSVRRYNVGNTIVGLGLSSQFGIPLQTGLDVALNLNSLPPGLSAAGTSFNYTTVALRGRYEIEKDILSVSGALTPTFGNFKRTVIDVGSEWLVQQTMSVQLQFTFFSNAGSTNDTFVNLRCRYDV